MSIVKLVSVFIFLLYAFPSFGEVTSDDVKKAEQIINQQDKDMDRQFAERANSQYKEITDQQIIEKMNELSGAPEGTKWYQDTKSNNVSADIDLYKFTKKYQRLSESDKRRVDEVYSAQKERKRAFLENPRNEEIMAADKEIIQSDESKKIEAEFRKQRIMDKAQELATKRIESAEAARISAGLLTDEEKQEALRKRNAEAIKKLTYDPSKTQQGKNSDAESESDTSDQLLDSGHNLDFDIERMEILEKLKRGESIDGDRFDRLIEILDTTA